MSGSIRTISQSFHLSTRSTNILLTCMNCIRKFFYFWGVHLHVIANSSLFTEFFNLSCFIWRRNGCILLTQREHKNSELRVEVEKLRLFLKIWNNIPSIFAAVGLVIAPMSIYSGSSPISVHMALRSTVSPELLASRALKARIWTIECSVLAAPSRVPRKRELLA